MKTFVSTDMSNEEYHGYPGTYSSSNLKVALEDIELFYKKCVTKEIKSEHKAVYDTGTYFHTKVLEPHLMDKEIAVYDGIKKGSKFEEFKKKHEGKMIVSTSQAQQGDMLAKLVEDSVMASSLVAGCDAEVSAFVVLQIDPTTRQIFNEDFTMKLSIKGWEEVDEFEDIEGNFTKLWLKVRADGLIKGSKSILDLKSTSGNAKHNHTMKRKISDFQYELSASFYLDLFSVAFGEKYDKFYWIFASKDKHNCKTYLATDENIMVGRAKWTEAVYRIVQAMNDDWEFVDTIELLDAEHWQKSEWLKEN